MTFEFQPVLEDELILLRPIREDDFDALYAAAYDPLIWEQHPASDRWQRDVFVEYFRGAIDSGGAFVVIDKQTGEILGSSRYVRVKESENAIEIGWTFLARKYWGGTYNLAMKRLMLDHAFKFVDNVLFYIGENNMRSRKAVEKLGGVLITELDSVPITAPSDARVIYRLGKDGWKNRQAMLKENSKVNNFRNQTIFDKVYYSDSTIIKEAVCGLLGDSIDFINRFEVMLKHSNDSLMSQQTYRQKLSLELIFSLECSFKSIITVNARNEKLPEEIYNQLKKYSHKIDALYKDAKKCLNSDNKVISDQFEKLIEPYLKVDISVRYSFDSLSETFARQKGLEAMEDSEVDTLLRYDVLRILARQSLEFAMECYRKSYGENYPFSKKIEL